MNKALRSQKNSSLERKVPAKRKKHGGAKKINVLIADDHSTFLAGLVSIIAMEPDMAVIAQAANGREAVDMWRKHRPSVTLLDLQMPLLDGIAAVGEIRSEDESARIVVLTTFDGDNDVYRAVKAGAKGYLLKDAKREDLIDCIRKVNRGESCIPADLCQKLVAGVNSDALTEREAEVLDLLAKGKSNKEIATALHISAYTVKAHLRGVYAKLHVTSRTEAITAASHRGLVRI
jgi:DNA-binding NarL/FixJ family response regulator